jgi:O-antigen/teichoic acid export membrane protein
MGIVVRQTFLSSISAYFGILIGYVNIVLFMPLYLSPAEIGLIRTINAMALLLVPLALIGSSGALVRFFPKVKNHIPQLMGLTLAMVFIAYVIVTGLSYLFSDVLFSFYEENAPEIGNYFWLIFGLLGMMVFFNYIEALSRAALDISTPNFFREVIYKSGHLLIVIFVGFGILSFESYLYSHLIIYIFLIIGLSYFVSQKVPFQFDFKSVFSQPFTKEVVNFSLYSILGSFGIMMVLQIDQLMVSGFLGLEFNGIYSTALYMAVVIELPRRLIAQISTPIIAKAYHEERYADINHDYKNVSNSLFFLGGFLFVLITLNLGNIYNIMPNGESFSAGIWVVYFIGLTKIIDMVFSVNGEIISMSKIFRLNVILILGLGIITVITNYIFIPRIGMVGAAIATMTTYFIFNSIKYILLKVKYGFDPFSMKTLYLLLTMTAGYFFIAEVPALENPWFDIVVRSMIIGLYFIVLFWVFKPSPEILEMIQRKVNSKK